jgi:mRNA-degrading endonuclease RelE of RelBE toxin-antitoxin system
VSERKRLVTWAPKAQQQLRAIDRELAIQILRALDEYLATGQGDVKKLRPPRTELRLRVGDYRVFFYRPEPLSLVVVGVKHRSDAYD